MNPSARPGVLPRSPSEGSLSPGPEDVRDRRRGGGIRLGGTVPVEPAGNPFKPRFAERWDANR